jgi:SAM-dependent methyltransferase
MIKSCRNCLSENVKSASTGIFAPFFLKRVFGIELINLGQILQINQNSQLIEHFQKNNLNQVLGFQSPALTSIRVCEDCGFVGPEMYFSQELLQGLYQDYRLDSYNQERCKYEPYYQQIQHLVGKDARELVARLDNIDALLKIHVDIDRFDSVLDWGGGEGRFVPRCLVDKKVFILDVSDEPLANQGFTRINEPDPAMLFDFIQICHVLEHVSSPNEFLKVVVKSLKPGGVLYIEVPQDQSDENISKFKVDPNSINHTIHEHLNLFSHDALSALGSQFGLDQIVIDKHQIDLGWIKGVNLSALFRNPN